jgi:hypothetical protein
MDYWAGPGICRGPEMRARSRDSAAQIQAAWPTSARGPRSVSHPRARLTSGSRWSARQRHREERPMVKLTDS